MSSFERSDALQREFDGASDRAAAIVAGAFLDEVLQELLQEFFVEHVSSDKKIFQGTGPLATFSAKIDLAYRLGLVSEREFRALHIIRDIRNEFAHQLDDISFTTQSVAARCRNIEFPIELVSPRFIPCSQSGEMPPTPTIDKADPNQPRAVFQEAVFTLIHMLSARVAVAGDHQRSTPNEFAHAIEPAEYLLARMKSLLQRSDSLAHDERVSAEERESLSSNLRRFFFMVEVQSFIVQQIRSAHEVRCDKTQPL